MRNFLIFVFGKARRVKHTERGASLVEYALLLALIAAVCIVAVGVLGTTTSSQMDADASSLFVRN